jgi:pimeloyl-ACP methyl ester carboxylesterase
LLSKKSVRWTALAVACAVGGAVALATDSSATAAAPSVTATQHQAKPTIVLVHGAWADASSWNPVMTRLHQAGYTVYAPPNPLRGVASDAETVADFVNTIPGPVILVGHSYGGSVISEAAVGDANVKALVYVAAFLPAPGETALQLTNQFPGSTLPSALDPVPFTNADGGTGTDLYIQQDKFRHQFAADVKADQAELMAESQRPIAQAALEEKATGAAWETIPSWDVVTTQDLNIPPAAQEFMAARAHAHVTEVAASHSVAVSHPDVVADVIERAARATR